LNLDFIAALDQIQDEKGIPKELLLEAIEQALISAYRKNFGSGQNVRVEVERDTGEVRVLATRTVVEKVTDPLGQMSLKEAQELLDDVQVGDEVEVEVTPREFGRIAAQTAKQVVVQRIREAERGIIFEEYSSREGDIVTGIVQRMEGRNVLVDLGRAEAILLPSEQSPGERYRQGDRLKLYIVEVRKTTKGPQIFISRTHPGLVKRLFEMEVPEIHDGVVEIKAISREPGSRAKVAVSSNVPHVDPVGACVGPKGVRVQQVVSELRGEKIDIVRWDRDAAAFVGNALSPARTVAVYLDEANRVARVVVPDHQLSLAIGKEGQNARLAARLTGWKIDIRSESQWAEELARAEAEPEVEEAEEGEQAAEEDAVGATLSGGEETEDTT